MALVGKNETYTDFLDFLDNLVSPGDWFAGPILPSSSHWFQCWHGHYHPLVFLSHQSYCSNSQQTLCHQVSTCYGNHYLEEAFPCAFCFPIFLPFWSSAPYVTMSILSSSFAFNLPLLILKSILKLPLLLPEHCVGFFFCSLLLCFQVVLISNDGTLEYLWPSEHPWTCSQKVFLHLIVGQNKDQKNFFHPPNQE